MQHIDQSQQATKKRETAGCPACDAELVPQSRWLFFSEWNLVTWFLALVMISLTAGCWLMIIWMWHAADILEPGYACPGGCDNLSGQ